LTDICQNLINENNYNASFAFDIFNIILKDYIKLLDIDAIYHHENNNFLRKLFRIIRHYDIEKLVEEMSMKTRREIYFSLFDRINASTRIISYLQNDETTDPISNNSCSFILHTVFKVLIRLRVKLTSNDLEKYQTNLFITFIDQYFIKKQSLRVNEKQNSTLIYAMLSFIVETTDKTLTIPIFINANCPQACLKWLSASYLDIDEYEAVISILCNIARHDEGTIILKKLECGKILRQFKKEILNNKIDFIMNQKSCSDISQLLDLLLVLVVDPEELYSNKLDRDIVKQVLLLSRSQFEMCHISELLISIMKLSTNDNIMEYILQQDQYPMSFFMTLKTILSDIENLDISDDYLYLDILAILALVNILWSISFHDRYKNDLVQNTNLIKNLELFRKSDTMNFALPHIYIPHQMSSLRRSIDGIWQNLYPSLPSQIELKSTTCSIMISYSHVNIDFSRQLYDVLSKLPELSISIDTNNGTFLWKDIAQTIERSHLVLVLISKDYFYSKSCRQELIYIADTMKKLFFPVFIDQDFKPTGWLQQRIARLRSIRFGENDFMNTCEELLSLINENLSMNMSLTKNSFNITKWNDVKVKQWFTNNNIIPELYDFYHFNNGMELLLYAQATLASPWTKEYERIKLRFEEKFKHQEQNLSEDQFLQFINALKRLEKRT
jgi:hypothetical protein